jgi:hypothetical protein
VDSKLFAYRFAIPLRAKASWDELEGCFRDGVEEGACWSGSGHSEEGGNVGDGGGGGLDGGIKDLEGMEIGTGGEKGEGQGREQREQDGKADPEEGKDDNVWHGFVGGHERWRGRWVRVLAEARECV